MLEPINETNKIVLKNNLESISNKYQLKLEKIANEEVSAWEAIHPTS